MWTLLCYAWAQQGPLALPAKPDVDFRPTPVAGPPRLTEYRQRAVSVRRYTTVQGGGATAVGWGWGWPGFGSPYGGFSTTYIVGNPTYEVERWSVYRGSQRLTVPEWMDVADVPDAREALTKRVRRTKTWHRVFLGAAVAGGVAMVGSGWASQSAASYEEFETWQLGQAAGSSALVGGAIGAFMTGMNARSLRYDYERTQDVAETQEWARAHNQRLREELGLTSAQTAAVDRGE